MAAMYAAGEHGDRGTRQQWQLVAHELPASIGELAGDVHGWRSTEALQAAWTQLCVTDLDLAARYYHAATELLELMAMHGRPDSPAEHGRRRRTEMLGLADIGLLAEALRGSAAMTLEDLVDLGTQVIREEIDRETRSD